MANVVGDIAIQIGADIAPLITNLGKGVGAVKGFGSAADAAASGPMRRMASAAGVIAGVATAAAIGLAAMTKHAIDSIGALNDAAKATGLHVAQLQAMQQVAGEAGVEANGLTKAIVKMQDSIANATAGAKAQAAAFQALGLSVSYLAELSPEEQFAQIAEAINSIDDPANRASAAINIFGKAGADLIPMMDGYRTALQDATEYQRQFGIAISDTDAAKIDGIGDSMARLGGTAEGVGTRLAVAFGPEIQNAIDNIGYLMEKAAAAAIDLGEALETTRAEKAMEDIAGASSDMVSSISQAAIGLQGLADNTITQALNGHAQAIQNATHDLQDGKLTAAEYRDILIGAAQGVISVYQEVETLDGTDMSGAIEAMNDYARAIGGPLDQLLALIGLQQEAAATAPAPTGGLVLGAQGFGGRPDGLAGTNRGAVGLARNHIAANVASSSGGGKGGGGGNSADDLKSLRESLATETEAANAEYEERLKKLDEFRAQKLLTEAEYNDLELRAKQEHSDALAEIDGQSHSSRISAYSSMFGDLASLMQSSNKRTFEIGKAASIAGAVIDGIEAGQSAFKAGMKVGGPVAAYAFASASAIKTLANVNAIRSTQIGGGSSGGGSGGGSSASSGASSSQSRGPMQVTLTGLNAGDLFSGSVLSGLLDKLNAEAGDRGYKILGVA
jgi:hypothetical protein